MNYVDLNSVPGWDDGLLGLMYHAIEAPPLLHPLRGLYVEPTLLETQLRELAEAGVKMVSLADCAKSIPSSERAAFVTFDDAFRNVLEQGLPVLQRWHVCATTYVVANKIGQTNAWDADGGAQMRPLMDREDLSAWLNAGQEIGSHSLTHCDLTAVPMTQARAEIFESKAKLEDICGRPVLHFCYPYGKLNRAIRDLVEEAGYATATTTEPFINGQGADRLMLGRWAGSHRRPYRAALRGALRRVAGLHA